MAAIVYRVDSRDPNVINDCDGFKLNCPAQVPPDYEPVHYMHNNLGDFWGATWSSQAVALEYINRYAPFSRAWIYMVEAKREHAPAEEIIYTTQPDLSGYPWSNVPYFRHSVRPGTDESNGDFVENPDYRKPLWSTVRQSITKPFKTKSKKGGWP
ncbi:uncharacterized protein PpBr36_09858 [Pyricularia pennisetigena]|uniref:uncharacterized protein n=1 Tax=Pyricularia pennisetigena TaxID=1578925 RepID=UPI001152DE42|nr:uncharacterized protein PpBr36_09858 [Pyricularia pennisetigena]TLS22189.1 hypothetical protein PpBr36_09858 [Pyricularia pennisetigena]